MEHNPSVMTQYDMYNRSQRLYSRPRLFEEIVHQDFGMPIKLARKYAAIVFLCRYRVETSGKVTSATLSDLIFMARTLMRHWTTQVVSERHLKQKELKASDARSHEKHNPKLQLPFQDGSKEQTEAASMQASDTDQANKDPPATWNDFAGNRPSKIDTEVPVAGDSLERAFILKLESLKFSVLLRHKHGIDQFTSAVRSCLLDSLTQPVPAAFVTAKSLVHPSHEPHSNTNAKVDGKGAVATCDTKSKNSTTARGSRSVSRERARSPHAHGRNARVEVKEDEKTSTRGDVSETQKMDTREKKPLASAITAAVAGKSSNKNGTSGSPEPTRAETSQGAVTATQGDGSLANKTAIVNKLAAKCPTILRSLLGIATRLCQEKELRDILLSLWSYVVQPVLKIATGPDAIRLFDCILHCCPSKINTSVPGRHENLAHLRRFLEGAIPVCKTLTSMATRTQHSAPRRFAALSELKAWARGKQTNVK
mmetsp:Transcript_5031/g.7106  ORF Transcript_5031/g.7106 Transcript_5031/m.7106 type:complete len:481 (-) Transcript_5031:127-1569(-)